MENHNLEHQKFERAQKRVKALSGFYKHAIVYVLVNLFLITIHYFSLEPGEVFFEFSTFATAFFWGFGLVFHALGVFGPTLFFGHDWEEKKIRELMDREKKQKWE